MVYKTKGVCSQSIDVEVENGIVKHVQFTGGCNGKHPGRFQTDRRHGCKGGNQTSGRHSLRHASHLLPGSAGSGLKAHPCRGNEIIELMKIITAAVFLHSRRVFYVLFCPDGTVESFCLSDLGIRDLIQRIGDGFKGLRAGAL